MVNSVKNDRGKYVTAIGAPGSEARVKVEYPKLIDRVNSLWNQEAGQDEAIEAIRDAGIKDRMTTTSIMDVSHYGQDPCTTKFWRV